ncbi:uncharacterized protein LOC115877204 [Sitophilus oryzae]|uniref:Uncharacterized protein LOC115877204 n=1 Tax=Sitophilus oryzae TaxID=7048 RepID=A0A6J2XD19_SITOR|nr:uncharacterized protein LOC115877204 [Sitophilus oryzae]
MARNALNNLRKALQKSYAEKRFKEADGNYRKIWNTINEIGGRKTQAIQKIRNLKDESGEILDNAKEKANAFNKYFSTIGQQLAAQIKHVPDGRFTEEEVSESIFLEPTTHSELKSVIINLKSFSAPGDDGITKSDLITCFSIIENPLIKLINDALETGIYPEELKIGKIIPIYKKGPQTDIGNYRPITLYVIQDSRKNYQEPSDQLYRKNI